MSHSLFGSSGSDLLNFLPSNFTCKNTCRKIWRHEWIFTAYYCAINQKLKLISDDGEWWSARVMWPAPAAPPLYSSPCAHWLGATCLPSPSYLPASSILLSATPKINAALMCASLLALSRCGVSLKIKSVLRRCWYLTGLIACCCPH